MAYFVSPASKLERALRALLIIQGKATWDDCFVANESRTRPLPNRTIHVSQVTPTRPYRMEGACSCEIEHHFSGINDQGAAGAAQRVALDNYVGDTFDTLNLGGVLNDTSMNPLADAITNAGRWLATSNANGNTQADQIAADNQDMLNFRCDWVKFMSPMLTRGLSGEGLNWCEIIHIQAFVSNATVSN